MSNLRPDERAKHWQCDTEVQDLRDKPWRNEELKSLEEAPLINHTHSTCLDMIPEAFGWHTPTVVLSTCAPVAFPPVAFVQMVRRDFSSPLPIFLQGFGPMLPFLQPFWDLVSDFPPRWTVIPVLLRVIFFVAASTLLFIRFIFYDLRRKQRGSGADNCIFSSEQPMSCDLFLRPSSFHNPFLRQMSVLARPRCVGVSSQHSLNWFQPHSFLRLFILVLCCPHLQWTILACFKNIFFPSCGQTHSHVRCHLLFKQQGVSLWHLLPRSRASHMTAPAGYCSGLHEHLSIAGYRLWASGAARRACFRRRCARPTRTDVGSPTGHRERCHAHVSGRG